MQTSDVFDPHISLSIEDMLDELLRNKSVHNAAGLDRVYQAMRYSALAGGKRLRPYLTVACADMFDVPRTFSLRAGCAIELIHCYSLIHDDLPAMDNSDLRRGKPTNHVEFDEVTAILAGDGLLTEAFAVLAAPETHTNATIRTILIANLAHAAGVDGMVGGQMMDILAETGISEVEDIELLQSLKTGALINVSCRFGAYLAEESETTIKVLNDYASLIGLAFQITDDLLDVMGSEAKTGKPVRQDAQNEKSTFVEALGEYGARKKAEELINAAKDAVSIYEDKAQNLSRIADFILTRDT